MHAHTPVVGQPVLFDLMLQLLSIAHQHQFDTLDLLERELGGPDGDLGAMIAAHGIEGYQFSIHDRCVQNKYGR